MPIPTAPADQCVECKAELTNKTIKHHLVYKLKIIAGPYCEKRFLENIPDFLQKFYAAKSESTVTE